MTDLGYKDDGSFPQLLLDMKQNNPEDNGFQNTTQLKGKRVVLPCFHNTRFVSDFIRAELRTVSEYGNPDIVLGVGCNPLWPEVTRHINEHDLLLKDSKEIIMRVFKCKIDGIIKDVLDGVVFGLPQAVSWFVDFRDFEMPKAYIYIYLQENSKFVSVADTDNAISAEIPDVTKEPELYSIISNFMIAVPSTTNDYPKPFSNETSINIDGSMIYKRRDNGIFTSKDEVLYDNRFVVPYNRFLTLRYRTYISVDRCTPSYSVLRFLSGKVHSRARESSDYEGIWEKLRFLKSFRTVEVFQIAFHLPDLILENGCISSFLRWMEFNRFTPQTRNLTYTQFAEKFVWDLHNRRWIPRTNGKVFARLPNVAATRGEIYYLGILLHKVKGPCSFSDIRTVRGQICPTFRDACMQLGLVED